MVEYPEMKVPTSFDIVLKAVAAAMVTAPLTVPKLPAMDAVPAQAVMEELSCASRLIAPA